MPRRSSGRRSSRCPSGQWEAASTVGMGYLDDPAPGRPAAGRAHGDPAAVQHAHLARQGHLARLDDPGHRAAPRGAGGGRADVRVLRPLRRRRRLLLGRLPRALLRRSPASSTDRTGTSQHDREPRDPLPRSPIRSSRSQGWRSRSATTTCSDRSTSRSRREASPYSSAPPAPARRRCCARSMRSTSRTPAWCGSVTVEVDFARRPVTKRQVATLRAQSGMVFQSHHLFPHLTVLENVTAGPVLAQRRDRTEVETEARELLRLVGLDEKADAYPYQLSGGQQQRVGIARALADPPAAHALRRADLRARPRARRRGAHRHAATLRRRAGRWSS